MNRTEKEINVLIRKKENRLPVEQNSMELSPVFNTTKEEQKGGIVKRELGNNHYIEVGSPPNSKLIRNEDFVTLFSCFLLLKHSTKKGNAFETSYNQFFTLFGEERGRGWNYERLKKSLERLQSNYATTNFWFNTIDGERIAKYNFHFLESVGEGEEKSLRIRLSKDITESMEHGYLRWLEENKLKEILHLRGYARVLVLLLMKRINDGPGVRYKLENILDILGVRKMYEKLPGYRFNFYVKRRIIPAIEKAAGMIGYICTYKNKEKMFILEKKRDSLMSSAA